MVERVSGDLLAAPAEALVNTVNCEGVMGKGIAIQFRQAFPESYAHYRQACKAGDVRLGRVLVFDRGGLTSNGPRYILQFPTKGHWKSRSRLADIEAGLGDLVATVRTLGIRSIAIPPLGSGNGGLNWPDVRTRIDAAFADVPDVHVLLYEPGGAPPAQALRIQTDRPPMTPGRAATVALVDAYGALDYPLTAIEVQKLTYFGNQAGLLPGLTYVRHRFGPYADALNHVLRELDGHYVTGVGDRDQVKTELSLVPGAAEAALTALDTQPPERQLRLRLDAVRALIEGFETPYGMELLATVHWLFGEVPETQENADAAVQAVRDWNPRKRKLMSASDVGEAWAHLRAFGWTPAPTPALPLDL